MNMWRTLVLPERSQMRYLTDRDLETLTVWLLRLVLVLERVSGDRASTRTQSERNHNTAALDVEEAEAA
jgi:hypothetical protein